MPFSAAFDDHPLVKRVLHARHRPVAAYGVAVGLIVFATLLRWVIGAYAIEGIPFITYYPAIIIAALIGGFWPGILATALSAVGAWYLFLPTVSDWVLDQREMVSLLLFILMSSINVVVVALLHAAVERVMAQEQNSRVLIESAPNGIVVVDEQGTIRLVNEAAEKLFGYPQGELVGHSIDILVPPDHLDAHRAGRNNFLLSPERRTFRDLSARRKDGSEFPVDVGLDPVTRGGKTAVLATVIDISVHKQVQESQQLIIRELQHRTQNLFVVFQALVRRSLDESKTFAEAKFVLNGRLQALARAYAALSDAKWEGASLDEVLDRQFAGFSKRVTMSGCDIVVIPSAAQQFALIIHELATNALKYGALSVPDGQVSIECKADRLNGVFSFQWKETGAPPVSAPRRKGFGSVILLDSAQHFARSVEMEFEPHGLRYELQLQLSAIEAPKSRAKPGMSSPVHELHAGSN